MPHLVPGARIDGHHVVALANEHSAVGRDGRQIHVPRARHAGHGRPVKRVGDPHGIAIREIHQDVASRWSCSHGLHRGRDVVAGENLQLEPLDHEDFRRGRDDIETVPRGGEGHRGHAVRERKGCHVSPVARSITHDAAVSCYRHQISPPCDGEEPRRQIGRGQTLGIGEEVEAPEAFRLGQGDEARARRAPNARGRFREPRIPLVGSALDDDSHGAVGANQVRNAGGAEGGGHHGSIDCDIAPADQVQGHELAVASSNEHFVAIRREADQVGRDEIRSFEPPLDFVHRGECVHAHAGPGIRREAKRDRCGWLRACRSLGKGRANGVWGGVATAGQEAWQQKNEKSGFAAVHYHGMETYSLQPPASSPQPPAFPSCGVCLSPLPPATNKLAAGGW